MRLEVLTSTPLVDVMMMVRPLTLRILRETSEPIRLYLQDLEVLLRHLDTDRTNVMLSNDEL